MDEALMEHYTPELKADPIAAPILDKMTEKTIPDVLKTFAHSQHRLGSAVTFPAKNATEDVKAAFKTRVYEAGVFTAPPGKPEEYGITKPATIPDGFGWNDELASKFATTLHKHGASKELAADLVTLHAESMGGAQQTLKTSYDEGMTALKTEFGDKFDERKEQASRIAKHIFKSPEELEFFEGIGLGDHPAFLSVLMRLAPLAMQDSSFLGDVIHKGGEISGDDVRKEVADIMGNDQNPKYKLYWARDKATLEYVDNLYRKAYGDQMVELSGGITAGPA